MPAKPRWHADLAKIRASLAALPSPFLDRRAIEKLFHLGPRQANNLMRPLGGYRIGTAAVVSREDLLLKLDDLAGRRGYQAQATRKARVVDTLAEIRAQARPRRIAPPPTHRTGSALPEGARITAPGELTITFSTPEDLLGRVLGLAQSAAGNFAAFAAGLSPDPGAGCRRARGGLMSGDGVTQLAISVPRYEGPFDLLLALIRRNEYPIDALPVPVITGQFLAYVRSGPELDPDLAGEFVEVASWLVLLKSRSMLPTGTNEGPAPHEELRRAVLDHETLLAATGFLHAREGRSRPGAAGARPGHPEASPVDFDSEPPTVLDLVEAAQKALEAARAARSLDRVEAGSATVAEMIGWIQMELAQIPAGGAVSTKEWFRARPGAGAALLLGLLELAAKGALLLHQGEDCGAIRVKAAAGNEPDTRSRA